MTKVYELKGMDACKLQVTYLGIKVNLEFKNGNFLNNKRARVVTNNPFVQDAIEHDRRFGSLILLAEQIEEKPSVVVEEEEEPRPKKPTKKLRTQAMIDAEKAVEATTDKSTDSDSGKSAKEVKSVKSVNDAVEFFQKKGESVSDDGDIESLKEKYNVTFPELK